MIPPTKPVRFTLSGQASRLRAEWTSGSQATSASSLHFAAAGSTAPTSVVSEPACRHGSILLTGGRPLRKVAKAAAIRVVVSSRSRQQLGARTDKILIKL